MLPKPKSEAWLLCAFARNYSACASLEEESGNDVSPNSLKKQLASVLEGELDAQALAEKVAAELDVEQLDMPSFNAFKNHLIQCAQRV